MRYVIYCLGFILMMILTKPVGILFASIISIALSALAVTLVVDRNNVIDEPKAAEIQSNQISNESMENTREYPIEESEQKANSTHANLLKAHNLMNKSQRNTIYAFICFSLLVVALHNPTGGYTSTITHDSYMYSEYANAHLETTDCQTVPAFQVFEGVDPGTIEKCDYLLPLSKWQSKAAATYWLSFIGNVGWALFIAMCFTCIGFIFFRSGPRNGHCSKV